MGGSMGAFIADLAFGDDGAVIRREALTVGFDYRLAETDTLTFGLGVGLGGRLEMLKRAHIISPGWIASVGYSRRLLDGQGDRPFLFLSASFAASGASTSEVLHIPGGPTEGDSTGLYALDLRGGLTVGKTFYGVISPYGAARLFGGPVLWSLDGVDRTGTDTSHVQIAAGLVASLPRGVDLFAEVAPAFERGVSIGGGYSF